MRFLRALLRSARRPLVLRRCLRIALVVGGVLTAVNLGDVLLAGQLDGRILLKIGMNFAVPFLVSNLGAMSSEPSA